MTRIDLKRAEFSALFSFFPPFLWQWFSFSCSRRHVIEPKSVILRPQAEESQDMSLPDEILRRRSALAGMTKGAASPAD